MTVTLPARPRTSAERRSLMETPAITVKLTPLKAQLIESAMYRIVNDPAPVPNRRRSRAFAIAADLGFALWRAGWEYDTAERRWVYVGGEEETP